MSDLGTIGRRRRTDRLGGPLLWSAVLLVILVAGIRLSLGELVIVRGFHMAPNYIDGDVLIMGSTDELKHGDVVAIGHGDDAVFRRIIGLPGETISSHHGNLIRDDSVLKVGDCPSFTATDNELSARERLCSLEETSSGERYGTLGDFVAPDRPWFFRQESVTLATDEIFVLADDRKAAVGANTNGVLKIARVEGVVSSRVWRPDP